MAVEGGKRLWTEKDRNFIGKGKSGKEDGNNGVWILT